MNLSSKRFRILALDGGGIKGAFSASVLHQLEETTGEKIIDHFDMIVGTSTGGILAIGLGLGVSTSDLLKLYRDKGGEIFPSTGFLGPKLRTVRQLFRPKHSHKVLENELRAILGDKKFGDSSVRLVIPTYDSLQGRTFLLKTAHHERFVFDHGADAVDVALATSAAPTYFMSAIFPHHNNAAYVDGGVWANNPSLCAITEAVAFLDQPLSNIDLLSIGTMEDSNSFADLKNKGIAGWNANLINIMMKGQVEASHKQSMLLLGKDQFLRINKNTESGRYSLDKAKRETIDELIQWGRLAAAERENLEFVRQKFLNGSKVTPFFAAL